MYAATTSLLLLAGLMGAAATPHPECEPCAAISPADMEGLTNSGKYLCCDLTCETEPVAGCGIFGLPMVCKACYEGDSAPAYDADPEGGDAPAEQGEGEAPEGEAPEGGSSAAPAAPEEEPAEPEMAPEEEPMPTQTPAYTTSTAAGEEGDMSYSYDTETYVCTACDEAPMVLTEGDWAEMEENEFDLVCDPDCVMDATMPGCGAFGLPIDCRAVPSSYMTGGDPAPGTASANPSSGGGSSAMPAGPTTMSSSMPVAPEGGSDGMPEPMPKYEEEPATPEYGEEPMSYDYSPSEGGGGACSAEEEAMCSDISPAQMEALAAYDNGGKMIVCDPTCDSGDVSHCNYFGLGHRCRGCGNCESCVACP